MEATSTSETTVNFYQTTRRNNPEDSHRHTRRRENLKSHQVYPDSVRPLSFYFSLSFFQFLFSFISYFLAFSYFLSYLLVLPISLSCLLSFLAVLCALCFRTFLVSILYATLDAARGLRC
jgi:hypothetical protein